MAYYCLKSLTHKTEVFIWEGVSRGKIRIPSSEFALLPYVLTLRLLFLTFNTVVTATAAPPASLRLPVSTLNRFSLNSPSPSELPLACCWRGRGGLHHFFLVSLLPYMRCTCTKLTSLEQRTEKSSWTDQTLNKFLFKILLTRPHGISCHLKWGL